MNITDDLLEDINDQFSTDLSLDELKRLANHIIVLNELHVEIDPVAIKNADERYGFTAYGKKEDWE